MIPQFPLHNLLEGTAQMLVIASLGVLLPVVFRIRHPRTHLAWCQFVLAVCALLPWLAPRQHPLVVIAPNLAPAAGRISAPPVATPSGGRGAFDPDRFLIWVLIAGAAGRLCWLMAGLWQIRRYRIAATPLYPLPPSVRAAEALTGAGALVCISPEFQSPVTFGLFHPVILLPESFRTLEPDAQVAIACHELLHVRRRDWFVSLLEEAAATMFWFHPGVWWLLSRIRLTREQLVDSEVVRLTDAPEPYIRALMAIAGMRMRLDLVPAPLFLRRRHLTLRMHSLLNEVPMSKIRLSLSYASITAILALSAWTAFVSFPLVGQPQIRQADAPEQPGISVDTGGAILHRPPVAYSEEARSRHVEGTVVLQLQVNAAGEVEDARAVSGPDALRRPALQSALQWHYAPDALSSRTVRATINFQLPPPDPNGPDPALLQQIQNSTEAHGVVNKVDVSQLPEPLRSTVWEQVKGFQGQGMSNYLLTRIRAIASAADPHLHYSMRCPPGMQDYTLTLFLGSPAMPPAAANAQPAYQFAPDRTPRVVVGSAVMAAKLIQSVAPAYPSGATGTVSLWILIGPDGRVSQSHVQDGPAALQQAAIDAVTQWTYKPTTAGGVAVEVETLVKVPFGTQ